MKKTQLTKLFDSHPVMPAFITQALMDYVNFIKAQPDVENDNGLVTLALMKDLANHVTTAIEGE